MSREHTQLDSELKYSISYLCLIPILKMIPLISFLSLMFSCPLNIDRLYADEHVLEGDDQQL